MESALVLRDDRAAAVADPPLALANNVELPADLLYEILLRVPAKALCRLRLVCRSWCSLTSDPRFIRAHSSHHPLIAGIHRGCFKQGEIHIVDMYSGSIDKRIRDHGTRVLESSLSTQGNMVCFSAISTIASQSQARVVNPATGVTNILPIGIMRIGLLPMWILGHVDVPSTGEHKVFRVVSSYTTNPAQSCEALTLVAEDGTQRWRAAPRPSNSVSLNFLHMAVLGGVVYFLFCVYYDKHVVVPDVEHDSIVMFDLAKEEWRPTTIRGPLSTHLVDAKLIYDHRLKKCLQLAKLDGCLAMVHHDDQYYSMDLWFLVEMNKGTWTKLYSIQYATDMMKCDVSYRPYPMLVLDDGKVVVWFGGRQLLRAYDPRIDTWEDMAMLENYHPVSVYEGSLLGSGHQC
ncbi:unnamed protein product [Urochloa humidicola]